MLSGSDNSQALEEVLDANLMDWKSRIREDMPLSPIVHEIPPGISGRVNPGAATQVTPTSCTPPPAYHNINLPLEHLSISASDRAAPPSYEEAIDPNGMMISYFICYKKSRKLLKFL